MAKYYFYFSLFVVPISFFSVLVFDDDAAAAVGDTHTLTHSPRSTVSHTSLPKRTQRPALDVTVGVLKKKESLRNYRG